MSPEQALGYELDYSTDIFSLGVVLYRMATGRLPFAGNSIGETIGRILHSEPEPITRFNSKIPIKLQRVIHRCLEKDRKRRYRSALELLADLKKSRLPLSVAGAPFWQRLVTAFGVVRLLVCLAALTLIDSSIPTIVDTAFFPNGIALGADR